MRLLAVSDMHGDLSAVIMALESRPFDLLLCCGDWGDAGCLSRTQIVSIVERVHTLTVYGNHDDIELLSGLTNRDGSSILLRSGEIRDVGGIRVAGISGIWARSHRQLYYVTDEDVYQIATSLSAGCVDVLLSHGCAVGLVDDTPSGRRGGQRCFLDAFHIIGPRIYLCGHLHRYQQRVPANGQVLINVGHAEAGDVVAVDIDGGRVEFEHSTIL